MGLADRVLARTAPREARAIAEWGTSAIPGPLGDMAGSGTFASIDLRKAESAYQKVAVWAAIDLIAGVASQLPLDTYRLQPDGTSKQIDSPKLVKDPGGDGYGTEDWVYQYLTSKLTRGNAYGKAVFDPTTAYAIQIMLYHPDTVRGWRDRSDGAARWRIDGKEVPASEVWHRRSYPVAGQLLGQSPIQLHATTIGQGIAAARFGHQFFSDGAHPSALFHNDEMEIDQKIAIEVKARYMSAMWGTREPLVLGKGWNHKPLTVNPEESQFLETQRYTGAECCRIYGPNVAEILGYESGGSMTYANQVDRALAFLKFPLNRWLHDVETVFTANLPRPQFVQFRRAALLETDILSRYRAHNMAIAGRFMAPSEVRQIENLPPLTPEQQAEIDALNLPAPTMAPLKESEK